MAKKVFTDESLATFVDEIKAYTDDAVSGKANSSHTHTIANVNNLQSTLDAIDEEFDTLTSAVNGKAASNHTHGNITNDGKIGTTANKAVITTTNGVLTAGTVPVVAGGTGATTAAAALTNLGLTATAAELNKMDGVTATTAEINYLDGVTSSIQTQLDERALLTHASRHKIGGADPITPADIGAQEAIPITSDVPEDSDIWIDPSEEPDDMFYTKGESDTKFAEKTHASRHKAGGADAITPEDIGAVAEKMINIDGEDIVAVAKSGKSGFYAGTNVTNAPDAAYHKYLVICFNADNATVLCFDFYNIFIKFGTVSFGAWTGWKEVATTDYAVPLDGSKAMTGNLAIETSTYPTLTVRAKSNGTAGKIIHNNGVTTLETDNTDTGVVDYRQVHIYDSNRVANVANALRFDDVVSGARNIYYLLHTGNKPSGSYTGNGSAAERTINTGGIGNACLVWGWDTNFMLVTYSGCINCVTYDNRNTATVSNAVKFRNGVLIINTADGGANANGGTYCYQVL